jgi:hypothetical protein
VGLENRGFLSGGFENQWLLKEGSVVFVEIYKYMRIYLWTALRSVVFERGIYGF